MKIVHIITFLFSTLSCYLYAQDPTSYKKDLETIVSHSIRGYKFNEDSLNYYIKQDMDSVRLPYTYDALMDSIKIARSKYKSIIYYVKELSVRKDCLGMAYYGYLLSYNYIYNMPHNRPFVYSSQEYKGYLYIWKACLLGSAQAVEILLDYHTYLGNIKAVESIYLYLDKINIPMGWVGLFKLYYYGTGIYDGTRSKIKTKEIDMSKGLFYLKKAVDAKDPVAYYYQYRLNENSKDAFYYLTEAYKCMLYSLKEDSEIPIHENIFLRKLKYDLDNKYKEKWEKYKKDNNIEE